MATAQFSLSWDAHKRNICNGLSYLQQNGEFVDMTLAADGHHVKVHQVIIAVASPYIKELIASAQCPHPVIFLNKISYTTLSAILEYIYTGEVLVSIENLNELIVAAKELHIKGLEDMKIHKAVSSSLNVEEDYLDDKECYFEITRPGDNETTTLYPPNSIKVGNLRCIGEMGEENMLEETLEEENISQEEDAYEQGKVVDKKTGVKTEIEISDQISEMSVMQYTVSNQGSLQMILNRFLYYLKHTNKDGTRQWRCVDYLNTYKCPAHVVTRDDVVLQRVHSHTHPFHDKRIMKKVEAGAIFTAITEAELEGHSKRIVHEAQKEDKSVGLRQDKNGGEKDNEMDYTV